MTTTEIAKGLSLDDKFEVYNDFKLLREQGSLGDCLLRVLTEEHFKTQDIPLNMMFLGYEVAVCLADEYLGEFNVC
jgi:hypothetical protein